MFLYGMVTSTWDIFRFLASKFLLITLLMRSRDPVLLLWYDSVWYCVSCRKSYVHRHYWKNMRAAGRLVLYHKCGLNSVFHTRFVFRQCSNRIFVSNRSTYIVFANEEVEKSAPWTRYQLNNNADNSHLGVKPRL
jgi:hypothetical protein